MAVMVRADYEVISGEMVGSATSGNFSATLEHGIALSFLPPHIETGPSLEFRKWEVPIGCGPAHASAGTSTGQTTSASNTPGADGARIAGHRDRCRCARAGTAHDVLARSAYRVSGTPAGIDDTGQHRAVAFAVADEFHAVAFSK